MKTSETYKIAKEALQHRKKLFDHGLGHGIGIAIHELPNLKPLDKGTIKENMIFTIEPGIYIPKKYGIRIEDDILMTRKGPKVLTKTTKSLIIIKK